MPYKRRPRPRYRKKRRWTNYRTATEVAKNALSIASSVRGMLNVEYKVKENVQNASAIASTGTGQDLVNLVQGTGNTNRVGDQVKYTSLFMNYYININSSASVTAVRTLLVLDKQPNNAGFSLADVLKDGSSPSNIVSPLNLDNKYRFKILYDKVDIMSINGNRFIKRKKFMKLNLKVRYGGGNAGTTADIDTNNLAIFWISDEATNTPSLESSIRLRYVDN